jgi:predicted ATPase
MTTLPPPFLKRATVNYDTFADKNAYPANVPVIAAGGFDLKFTRNVTILMGDNGIGKSSIIEAIAANCRFSLSGGNRNYVLLNTQTETLSRHMKFSWLPKITNGYFVRAEALLEFMDMVDEYRERGGFYDLYDFFGGRSLKRQSHGQVFQQIFWNHVKDGGIFVLDEPESALSPMRQLEFLRELYELDQSRKAQVIIATHSPLIMAYPHAQLLALTDKGVKEITFKDTLHFRLLHKFYKDPDYFMNDLFEESA